MSIAVKLRILSGAAAGREAEFTGPSFVVGRSPNAGLVIDDSRVSLTHVQIKVSEGRVEAIDLAGRLLVNGERVPRAFLKEGDRITIGQTEIGVSIGSATPRSAPAAAASALPAPQAPPPAAAVPPAPPRAAPPPRSAERPASGRRIKVIQDLLEEHHDELQFLWGQRQAALRSPRYTWQALLDLEERIEAHVQGLLVGGDHVVALVEGGLTADDPLAAFAAAYTFLRFEKEDAARRVLGTFLQAQPGQLDGLRQALLHGPITPLLPQLREALASSPPAVAAATAEVLAFRSASGVKPEQCNRLLQNDAADVREAGWRVIGLGVPQGVPAYEAALRDESRRVRREALVAAAWNRQVWLLEHCRRLAGRPTSDGWDALWLLAVLGRPDDLPRILAVGEASPLGPRRFEFLAAFGHPGVVETLLKGIESKDPRTAVSAGAAFTKVTGVAIDSDRRVSLPPEDGSEPDEFEKEFLEQVTLPDPDQARAHWQKVKGPFSEGTRWCRGLDVSRTPPEELLARLDMESRWEAQLRRKFEGTWDGRRTDLEVFPQTRTR
jgi:uncharacterized protein (TIGR02270 family)